MNFLDFITEDTKKELYVIINMRDGTVPKEGDEPYKTWAVSPAKAKWQIIHRLKQEPDKYAWKVINNPDDYEPISWDKYKNIEDSKRRKYVPPQEPSPNNSGRPEQLKLFNDPQLTTPY